MMVKGARRAMYSLALVERAPGRVVAVEELSVEELHADHAEDEEEEHVDDEDIQHILERGDNTVEHSLERGHAVHHLERPQHAEQLHRLQVLADRGASAEREEKAFVINNMHGSEWFENVFWRLTTWHHLDQVFRFSHIDCNESNLLIAPLTEKRWT